MKSFSNYFQNVRDHEIEIEITKDVASDQDLAIENTGNEVAREIVIEIVKGTEIAKGIDITAKRIPERDREVVKGTVNGIESTENEAWKKGEFINLLFSKFRKKYLMF